MWQVKLFRILTLQSECTNKQFKTLKLVEICRFTTLPAYPLVFLAILKLTCSMCLTALDNAIPAIIRIKSVVLSKFTEML